MQAGWLVENEDGTVTFPHFDRHNGKTAKKRSVSNRRVAEHRKNKRDSNDGSVTNGAKCNDESVTKSVTREEKRRDIKEDTNVSSKKSEKPNTKSDKRGTRLGHGLGDPQDWAPPQEWRQWAVNEGLPFDRVDPVAVDFRDYWISQPGQKGVKLDWLATWRRWVRKEIERSGQRARTQQPEGDSFASVLGQMKGG